MFDIIKDYLISISADVDNKAFKEIDNAIKNTENRLGKFSSTAVGKIATAGSALISFYGAVAGASAKLATSVANADRKFELLAKRFYTTEKNFRSLSLAMKAMGISSFDELQDVALNPEMRSQFTELRSLATSLDNGKYKQALRDVRAFAFEFQKFSIRFEYFKTNVVANFVEALKPTIVALKKDIEPFVNKLIKEAPKYAKAVGTFMARVVQVGIHVTQAFAQFFKWLYNLPDLVKKIGLAVTGLAILIKSRFGAIMLTLQTLFLIIDDFMVYQKGGLSEYSDFWDFVTGKTNGINIDTDSLGLSVFKELYQIVKDIKYYVSQIANKFGIKSIVEGITSIPEHTLEAQQKVVNAIFDKIGFINKPKWYTGQGKLKTFSGDVGNIRFLKPTQLSEPLAKFISGVNSTLSSNMFDYGKEAIITSGTENRRSGQHPKGEAFDIAFNGFNSISKNFNRTMAYLRSLYATEGFRTALIETDNQEFVKKVRQQLKSEGYDLSKIKNMTLKEAGATGENIHTEINPNSQNIGAPSTVNISNNFYGYDTERINQTIARNSYGTISSDAPIIC